MTPLLQQFRDILLGIALFIIIIMMAYIHLQSKKYEVCTKSIVLQNAYVDQLKKKSDEISVKLNETQKNSDRELKRSIKLISRRIDRSIPKDCIKASQWAIQEAIKAKGA